MLQWEPPSWQPLTNHCKTKRSKSSFFLQLRLWQQMSKGPKLLETPKANDFPSGAPLKPPKTRYPQNTHTLSLTRTCLSSSSFFGPGLGSRLRREKEQERLKKPASGEPYTSCCQTPLGQTKKGRASGKWFASLDIYIYIYITHL